MSPNQQPDLDLEGLVHDLNNVFETITEAADLLQMDPSWRDLAATIHRSLDRGRRLVGSYVETTRGAQEFDEILDRAVEFTTDFLTAIHRPKITFERRVEADLRLPGTAASWERVLVNLFTNAAHAMQRGGTVEVTAARTPDRGIELTVADEGTGIQDELLSKIFTPRFSTKSARSGLGLHIVASIVKGNGGTVTAANRETGKGAVFTIRLPGG
jgi:signal transduction histidine kinase